MKSFCPPFVVSSSTSLNRAFVTAIGDFAGNVLPRKAGLLTEPSLTITAGTNYPDLWLRDAAVNAWNAGSFIAPSVAMNSLLSVVERSARGYSFPHPDYYDSVIWIVGAWHHARVTGDLNFLRLSLDVARDVLARLRAEEFNEATGLYRGGSFFNDGVSGYPERYARPTSLWGNILDWRIPSNEKRVKIGGGLPMQCLSTNALYFMALSAAGEMAGVLSDAQGAAWLAQAETLRGAIRNIFLNPATGSLVYLIDEEGLDPRQELAGWAFACLAGIFEPQEQVRLAAGVVRGKFGIPSLSPTYERYAAMGGLGRHSGLVWPQVVAFWGDACARRGDVEGLGMEVRCLAEAALRHGNFTECWNPVTGQPDGGLQERYEGTIHPWESQHRTTWGATGFLRLVLSGVAGLRPEWGHLSMEPCLPGELGPLRIDGIRWRDLEITMDLRGSGRRIEKAAVNGRLVDKIAFAALETGERHVEVTLCDSDSKPGLPIQSGAES